jgi:CubicO group peptidase (beta-lactamase class C family)
MRRRLAGFCILAMAACTWSAAQATDYDFGPITAPLKTAVEETPLNGACLLVVKDRKTICQQCFGTYTPDTAIPIASSSKWFSSATIMTLVDEGKLKLDDPASKYLPKFTGKNGQITIRQLLSHTSGLPSQHAAVANSSVTLAEGADQIADVPLVAEPGKEFRYGAVSIQVAGRIAEIVGGKSWETLFQERIAKPLAMQHSNFNGLGQTANPRIAGGAGSTMNDYGNFLTMILNQGEFQGKQILSKDAIREMEHNQIGTAEFKQIADGNKFDSATLLRLQRSKRYGLGIWIDRKDESGQGIELSSLGVFGFRPWIDRQHGVIGVLLSPALVGEHITARG